MRSLPLILVVSLLASACGDDSPTSPSPFPASLTLQPGEQSSAGGLTIVFNRVSDDSRCPIDAMCVQAGDANVHITLSTGGIGSQYTLTVNKADTKRVLFRDDFQVELVTLQPHPQGSTPIQPSAYRATFTITEQ